MNDQNANLSRAGTSDPRSPLERLRWVSWRARVGSVEGHQARVALVLGELQALPAPTPNEQVASLLLEEALGHLQAAGRGMLVAHHVAGAVKQLTAKDLDEIRAALGGGA